MEQIKCTIGTNGFVLRPKNKRISVIQQEESFAISIVQKTEYATQPTVFHSNPRKDIRLTEINMSLETLELIVSAYKQYKKNKSTITT